MSKSGMSSTPEDDLSYSTNPRPEEFKKFKKVLYEIFQFDVADLDFGIYRILNEKREAVDHFIEEDLHEAVKQGIAIYVEGQTEELRQEVEEKRRELEQTGRQLGQNVFTKDGDIASAFSDSPLAEEYVELSEKLQAAEMADTTERRVYDDLAKFFRRYYDEGDFITQRRFRAGDSKYVVPYDGEEVMLHWANRDQYYVKTSEHFKNYRFDAQDYDVEFKLVDAESPKDNVKESDTRYFVLHGDDPVSVDTEAKTCTITMAYRAITEDEKEIIVERYNEEAGESRKRLDRRMLCTALEAQILDDLENATLRALLTQPRKESEDYSRLFAHLNRYTAANTADYFVHKDLEGFLSGQLEYFIQNEVLDLDDVLAGETPSVAQQAVNRAKVVKSVGERVITFLAQIENFQKRLFEKKKLVVDTGYCVTLDRVPEELYNDILENDEQFNEWRELYAVDEWDNGLFSQGYEESTFTRDFLEAHPHVMIDTQHFGQTFVDALLDHLSTLDDGIDNLIDGLCIQGENFQVLNLLRERFREKIQCVYIDPPYNTGRDDFVFKDKFRHSSWLSMMSDRMHISKEIIKKEGVLFSSIGDDEYHRMSLVVESIFDTVGPIKWRRNRKIAQLSDFLGTAIEYVVVGLKDKSRCEGFSFGMSEDNTRPVLNADNPNSKRILRAGTPAKCSDTVLQAGEHGARTLKFKLMDDAVIKDGEIKNDVEMEGPFRVDQNIMDKKLYVTSQKTLRRYVSDEEKKEKLPPDLISDKRITNEGAKSRIGDLFGDVVFDDNPKPPELIQRLANIQNYQSKYKEGVYLDFFAGSGTTGEAVLRLNREDDGSRKYILADMSKDFDEVMLPRLKKVAFSSDWKKGVPQGNDGISHVIQYHRLESYEDALNNIKIDKPNAIQQKIFDAWGDYEMRYMLEEETDGSETLLQPEAFENPFEYTLRIQHGMESPKQHTVDLEATFNYLIGLTVKARRVHHNPYREGQRYVVVTGTVESDGAIEDVVVIWRDREELDEDDLRREKAWIEAEIIDAASFDSVYVNGKSFIAGAEPLEITFRDKMDPAR